MFPRKTLSMADEAEMRSNFQQPFKMQDFAAAPIHTTGVGGAKLDLVEFDKNATKNMRIVLN